jgi:hypothetical protein
MHTITRKLDTLGLLKPMSQKYLFWPTLRSVVERYIKSCVESVIAKPSKKKQGLYTHLLVPNRAWESILIEIHWVSGYRTSA